MSTHLASDIAITIIGGIGAILVLAAWTLVYAVATGVFYPNRQERRWS